jgi:AraC-like DNA-binding protein
LSGSSRIAQQPGDTSRREEAAGAPPSRVSLLIVSAVNDALRQLGAGHLIPERIAALPRELANDPLATMSRSEYQQCLLRVRETMGEPALGLALGARLNEMSFRFFGALLATRLSLRDALTVFLGAQQTVLAGSCWRFVAHGDEALLGQPVDPELGAGAQLDAEIAVTALYRNLVHWLGEQQGKSVRAYFSYAPPAHSDRYRAMFGPQLQFHCALTGIAFPLALLDQTRPGADQELANAMSQLTDRWMPSTDTLTWTARARRTFANMESFASFRLQSLASQWGMSLRSLRRRLEAENTTLTAVLEAELYARATDLLTGRSHSLAQIAELLGYHEVNSFQRAFKRWSGVTPAEFRRRPGDRDLTDRVASD